jgi:hypothetical protein
MAEIAWRRLRDPAAELDRSAPAHSYGNDKANRFTKSSEFDAKRPSSRQHDHYIIGVPIDAVPRGAGHDFRKASGDLPPCHDRRVSPCRQDQAGRVRSAEIGKGWQGSHARSRP